MDSQEESLRYDFLLRLILYSEVSTKFMTINSALSFPTNSVIQMILKDLVERELLNPT